MLRADEIVVDAEFHSLIPPLSDSELEQLEQNLLRDGCLDPLIVWAETNILLDGHNRKRICDKNGIAYETTPLEFTSRDEAADWIDAHQLGRRNLNPDQMSLLRGRRYNRRKSQGQRNDLTSDQNDTKSTAARLASEHGVSEPTIKRDGQFARAVDALKAIDPEIEHKITNGKGKPKADVVQAAALLAKHPEKAAAILNGEASRKDVAKEIRRQAAVEAETAAVDALAERSWTVTENQDVVTCDALITDPPYGILDEDWEPEDLERFTREWANRWDLCGADFIAVFWSQRFLWEGRRWFDESFSHYDFQQLLVWVYRNNKGHQSREGFKQTWEPVLFYRRKDSDKQVKVNAAEFGDDMHDMDTHVAAVPQSNFNDQDMKQHPAQKPVSVMRWLVNALTNVGELVVDPFCGSGTTGVAALGLNREFHGIERSPEYRELSNRRIAAYGVQQAGD